MSEMSLMDMLADASTRRMMLEEDLHAYDALGMSIEWKHDNYSIKICQVCSKWLAWVDREGDWSIIGENADDRIGALESLMEKTYGDEQMQEAIYDAILTEGARVNGIFCKSSKTK